MTNPTTNVQERINAYWDGRGDSYDHTPGHGLRDAEEHTLWLAALRELLPPAPADALDVGTGTGFLALLLSELGYRSTGIDLAEGMLAVARAKSAGLALPPVWQIGDAADPPFEPESFDLLLNRHVLWTLIDPAQALANWQRLLRPGGSLVIIDGLWWADGRRPVPDTVEEAEPWQYAWYEHYNDQVQSALPLMYAQNLEPALQLVGTVGFTEIRVDRLDAIEEFERSRIADTTEQHFPRFVISARRPA